MPRRNHRIIVIGKVREFDEEAWKRLLMAYAYYLHEQRMEQASATDSTSPEDPGEVQAGDAL
jgi:hypothetical protein